MGTIEWLIGAILPLVLLALMFALLAMAMQGETALGFRVAGVVFAALLGLWVYFQSWFGWVIDQIANILWAIICWLAHVAADITKILWSDYTVAFVLIVLSCGLLAAWTFSRRTTS